MHQRYRSRDVHKRQSNWACGKEQISISGKGGANKLIPITLRRVLPKGMQCCLIVKDKLLVCQMKLK